MERVNVSCQCIIFTEAQDQPGPASGLILPPVIYLFENSRMLLIRTLTSKEQFLFGI